MSTVILLYLEHFTRHQHFQAVLLQVSISTRLLFIPGTSQKKKKKKSELLLHYHIVSFELYLPFQQCMSLLRLQALYGCLRNTLSSQTAIMSMSVLLNEVPGPFPVFTDQQKRAFLYSYHSSKFKVVYLSVNSVFPLAELQKIPIGQLIQPIEVPLNGNI